MSDEYLFPCHGANDATDRFSHKTLFNKKAVRHSIVYSCVTISILGSMFLYFIMMGGSVIMPLYEQTIIVKSATVSDLVKLPWSLAMAIVSLFGIKKKSDME